MKGRFALAAMGVVLVANAWLHVSVWWNRSDARGGTVELTERELRLPAREGESTALFLELDWDALSHSEGQRREPRWLDAAKLAELGFDCEVPLTRSDARQHYRSMRTALVYVVLEYEGDAWRLASPDRRRQTRLFAIDAGRDPERLREVYPDTGRFIIARGLVSLSFQEHDRSEGKRLRQPRLQGRIVALLPDRIFVPRPYNGLLEDVRSRGGSSDDGTETEPRFAVTLSWGRRHEPWVRKVRRIGASE